jgi:hypothetical protein
MVEFFQERMELLFNLKDPLFYIYFDCKHGEIGNKSDKKLGARATKHALCGPCVVTYGCVIILARGTSAEGIPVHSHDAIFYQSRLRHQH